MSAASGADRREPLGAAGSRRKLQGVKRKRGPFLCQGAGLLQDEPDCEKRSAERAGLP